MKSILTLLFVLTASFGFSNEIEDYVTSLKQDGGVNDFANLLNNSQEEKLEIQINAIEKGAGRQYIVCTIISLNGFNIEKLAVELENNWANGSSQLENGILILISKDDRELFVATGLEIENRLSDDEVQIIVDNYIIPYLVTNDYFAGISNGIDELEKQLLTKHNWLIYLIGTVFLLSGGSFILYDYNQMGGFDKGIIRFKKEYIGELSSDGSFVSKRNPSSSGGRSGGGGGSFGGAGSSF